MGNLLAYKLSFDWSNPALDRGEIVSLINEGLIKAMAFGDNIFIPEDFFDIQLAWGDFFQFIFCTAYEEQTRLTRFPWMTQLQHTTLINLFALMRQRSPGGSNNLVELCMEYPAENNGLFGLKHYPEPGSYVSCITSWKAWHRAFVRKDNVVRQSNRHYFFCFSEDVNLLVPENEINQMIRKGTADKSIIRLDTPKYSGKTALHNEKIHVHLKEKDSALNIDGTWKHGGCTLSSKARADLIAWGFVLPE